MKRAVLPILAATAALSACGPDVPVAPGEPTSSVQAAIAPQARAEVARALRLASHGKIDGSISAISYNLPGNGDEQMQLSPVFLSNLDEVCTDYTERVTGNGTCHASKCNYSKPMTFVAGGQLRVQGSTSPGLEDITMDANIPDQYSPPFVAQSLTVPYLQGGETLSFALTGNPGTGVQALSAALVAPYPAILSAPDVGTVIDRNQDFEVRWVPGQATPGAVLSISIAEPDYSELVNCVFPAADGAGVIPHELLGRLKAGQGSVAAETSAIIYDTATSSVNGAAITSKIGVFASKAASTAGGGQAFYGLPVTFQ